MSSCERVTVIDEKINIKVTKEDYRLTLMTGLTTKKELGLENVDNTSDEDKPVSGAVQAALDGKADANHFHDISYNDISDKPDLSDLHSHTNKGVLDQIQQALTTALKSAYDDAVNWINTNGQNLINHLGNKNNPHEVGKEDIGLGSVDNTSDAEKPISNAVQVVLGEKQNTLVSGNSIKTINGESVLGSGDIIVNASPQRVGFAAKTSLASIPASKWKVISFSTIIDDTNNLFSGTVYTIPEDGMYEVQATLVFRSVQDGNRYIIGFTKNNAISSVYIINRGISGGTNIAGGGGSVKEFFNAGDTVRVVAYCGNTTSLWSSNNYQSFSVYKI